MILKKALRRGTVIPSEGSVKTKMMDECRGDGRGGRPPFPWPRRRRAHPARWMTRAGARRKSPSESAVPALGGGRWAICFSSSPGRPASGARRGKAPTLPRHRPHNRRQACPRREVHRVRARSANGATRLVAELRSRRPPEDDLPGAPPASCALWPHSADYESVTTEGSLGCRCEKARRGADGTLADRPRARARTAVVHHRNLGRRELDDRRSRGGPPHRDRAPSVGTTGHRDVPLCPVTLGVVSAPGRGCIQYAVCRRAHQPSMRGAIQIAAGASIHPAIRSTT